MCSAAADASKGFCVCVSQCWIGMNDWASMGDFVWSDGEPVGYDNWNPGEPQGVGERAVAIMLLGGGNSWADAPDVRSR